MSDAERRVREKWPEAVACLVGMWYIARAKRDVVGPYVEFVMLSNMFDSARLAWEDAARRLGEQADGR
jgi:hypothetical protein